MLEEELKSQLEPFLGSVASASEGVLLLDYDGTLSPFKSKRDEAYPYPGVVEVLQEILQTGRTRLVVISGRDATEIFSLLSLSPRPEVWGSHGLQRVKV